MTADTDIPPIENASTLEPLADGRYQWRVCQHPGCNQVFRSCFNGNGSPYCPEHHRLHEDMHGTVRTPPKYEPKNRWTVDCDPSPDGFRAGAEFDQVDITTGIAESVFIPGTRFTHLGAAWTVMEGHLLRNMETGETFVANAGQTQLRRVTN